jgi:hypothetical protein
MEDRPKVVGDDAERSREDDLGSLFGYSGVRISGASSWTATALDGNRSSFVAHTSYEQRAPMAHALLQANRAELRGDETARHVVAHGTKGTMAALLACRARS